jgi:acyl carrier protein
MSATEGTLGPIAIQTLISNVVGVEVPLEGSFINYGGDSFQAVTIMTRIEEEWGVEVEFLDVLDSTPAGLAEKVADLLNSGR